MRRHPSTTKVGTRRGAVLVAIGALAVASLTLIAPAASAAAPDNDSWKAASVVTGLPFKDAVDTTTATTDAVNPPGLGRYKYRSVWYHVTVPTDGKLLVSTAGTRYTHKVVLYRADSATEKPTEWTALAAKRIYRTRTGGLVKPVSAGTDYFVAIGTWSGDRGGIAKILMRAPSEFSITLADTGGYDPVDGSARLLGAASSAKPTEVRMFVTLRQLVGDRVVTGTGYRWLSPTATPSEWSLIVSSSRPFATGAARVVESGIDVYDRDIRIARFPFATDMVTLE